MRSESDAATSNQVNAHRDPGRFDPAAVTRPDQKLLTYYAWVSLLTVLGFPFVYIAHYIKYRTLHYSFDDEGVSMAWGLLFRREITLTYRRIQDIHVKRNLFHRWLGLASVAVQTASGSAGAEMILEGIRDPEGLRDFLYSKMRGARGDDAPAGSHADAGAQSPDDEALALLREIREELHALRVARGVTS